MKNRRELRIRPGSFLFKGFEHGLASLDSKGGKKSRRNIQFGFHLNPSDWLRKFLDMAHIFLRYIDKLHPDSMLSFISQREALPGYFHKGFDGNKIEAGIDK